MTSVAYKELQLKHLYIRRGIKMVIELFPSCWLNEFELLLSKKQ